MLSPERWGGAARGQLSPLPPTVPLSPESWAVSVPFVFCLCEREQSGGSAAGLTQQWAPGAGAGSEAWPAAGRGHGGSRSRAARAFESS